MRLTTQKIIKKVRVKLLELTDDVIANDELLDAINLAYTDIQFSIRDRGAIQQTTLTVTNNEATLPTDFGTFYGYPKDQYGNEIRIVTIPNLDKTKVQCAVVGTALKVSDGITSIELNYFRKYDDLTVANSPETPELFDEVIVYGALHRMLEDLQDPEMSAIYGDKYMNLLELKLMTYNSYRGNMEEGQLFI